MEDNEVREGMLFALCSYLGILCLVPIFLKRDNSFVLFHAKQGLSLLITEIAAGMLAWVPLIGWLFAMIIFIFIFILSFIGIIQVLMGRYWKMPILGDFAQKFEI